MIFKFFYVLKFCVLNLGYFICEIGFFWEYEELKWFTDIIKIINYVFKMVFVIFLFFMNEDIGSSLYGLI